MAKDSRRKFLNKIVGGGVGLGAIPSMSFVLKEKPNRSFSKDLPVAIAFSYDPDSISSLIVFEDNFENKHSILQF